MTIQLAMEHKKLRVKEMRTVKENEGACKVATDKEDIDLKPYKNQPITKRCMFDLVFVSLFCLLLLWKAILPHKSYLNGIQCDLLPA